MMDWNICYSSCLDCIKWEGIRVRDETAFEWYLQGAVRERLEDRSYIEEYLNDIDDIMSDSESPDMDFGTLKEILCLNDDNGKVRKSWEIGEALAECILELKSEVVFPWNKERDKRVDNASLPGADLVGLIRENGTYIIIFGEVKTSDDVNSPPNVVYGRSGMEHQLTNIYLKKSVRKRLLIWLHSRCKNTDAYHLYKQAIREYVASKGNVLVLVGFLIRDTKPNTKDLESRAKSLSECICFPTKVELNAWYVPIKLEKWPLLIRGS